MKSVRISIKHVANLLNSQLNFHFYSIITAENRIFLFPFSVPSFFPHSPRDCFISIFCFVFFLSQTLNFIHFCSYCLFCLNSFSSWAARKFFKLEENCHELLGLASTFAPFHLLHYLMFLEIQQNFCFFAIIFFCVLVAFVTSFKMFFFCHLPHV